MTDDAAFLSAIIARPDDDLPRLVYADYLDERGDADRAEFVRVQCDLAALPAGDPRRPALAAREAELLTANKPRWVVPGVNASQQFRRGFVEVVQASADELIASAGRLFDAAPVRELRVYVLGNRAEQLARIPGLDRIETFDLSNNTFFSPAIHFLSIAPLPRLRHLILRNANLWPDAFVTLGEAAVITRLERLDLSGCSMHEGRMEALATVPAFAGLSELVVAANGLQSVDCIKAAGATALAQSTTLTKLRSLDLCQHYIGDSGVIALVRSPNAATLEDLDVSVNDIGLLGEAAVEAITESPHLGRLRVLRLGGERTRPDRRNRIDPRAAMALAGWPRLADGVIVDMRGCEMDDVTRTLLAGSARAEQFLLGPVEHG